MSGEPMLPTSHNVNGAHAPTPGTVAEWLALRSPPAPPALLERMREMLAEDGGRPVADAPQVCLSAGESRLAILLAHGATDRTSALDLLAVDALVSYAFEAAADTPETLEQIATDAMTRIAEIPEAS